MKKGFFLAAIMSILAFAAGCGGSGGGGGATTNVTGVVSKGLVHDATVSVYAITNGARAATPLVTGKTVNGAYNLSLGSYSGPVMVETSGGTYTDEATGTTGVAAPALRALISNVAGSVSAAVTPFTELAVRETVSSPITATSIDAANQRIATLYQLPDIITTLPVDASSAVPSGTAQARINYALALASISQLAQSKAGTADQQLSQVMTELAPTAGALQAGTAASFRTALSTFLASSRNATSVSDLSVTPFNDLGALPVRAVVKLALKETRNNIRFIDLNLDHSPAGTVTYSSNRSLNSDMNVFGAFPSASTLRVNMLRNSGVTGFNAAANSPIIEVSYDIVSGVPEFSVSNAILGLYNPATPNVSTEVPLTTDDFALTVTFE